jgi:hypothetical protein
MSSNKEDKIYTNKENEIDNNTELNKEINNITTNNNIKQYSNSNQRILHHIKIKGIYLIYFTIYLFSHTNINNILIDYNYIKQGIYNEKILPCYIHIIKSDLNWYYTNKEKILFDYCNIIIDNMEIIEKTLQLNPSYHLPPTRLCHCHEDNITIVAFYTRPNTSVYSIISLNENKDINTCNFQLISW